VPVEVRVVDGGRSRHWLGWLGLAGLVVMLIGALPSGDAVAAPAGQVAPPTATPTFSVVWTINDVANGNKVLVDPFSQQFQFIPVGDTPERAQESSMRYSRQGTSWKWSDTNRLCNATPVPPSSRIPRCPVFVWGSIDRVRHQAHATLFKRNPNGSTSVYQVDQRLTPLALPMPDEPAVELQGGRFSPSSKTLPDDTGRITFQNNSQKDCTIVFDTVPNSGLTDPTNNRPLAQFTEKILRGRASTPFPSIQPTPTLRPGQQPAPPPPLWIQGSYKYRCQESPGFVGIVVIKKTS
jgi:hypothetical protein